MVYLVIYDSGYVTLEHLLLSRAQDESVSPPNPLSQTRTLRPETAQGVGVRKCFFFFFFFIILKPRVE